MTTRIGPFEIILLIVGVTATFLGFQLINSMFSAEGELSWLMVISIFNWLTLLVLFILLSITVDVAKKQLSETQRLIDALGKNTKKKK